MSLLAKRGVTSRGRARWKERDGSDPVDQARERRLAELLREEEARRIRNAEDVAAAIQRARLDEREANAQLCQTFGPNLMALHLARLIRQKV